MKKILLLSTLLVVLAGAVVLAIWFDRMSTPPKTDKQQILETWRAWTEALAERDYEEFWDLTGSGFRDATARELKLVIEDEEDGNYRKWACGELGLALEDLHEMDPEEYFLARTRAVLGSLTPEEAAREDRIHRTWRIIKFDITLSYAWITTVSGEEGGAWQFEKEGGEWKFAGGMRGGRIDWDQPELDLPYLSHEKSRPWKLEEVDQILNLFAGPGELPPVEGTGCTILRADRRLAWQRVVEMLEATAAARVTEVGLGGSPNEYTRCIPARLSERIPFCSMERQIPVTLPAKDLEFARVVVVDVPAGLAKGFDFGPVKDLFRTLAEDHPDTAVVLNAPPDLTWAEVARALRAVAAPVLLVAVPGNPPESLRLNGISVDEATALGLPPAPDRHPALSRIVRRP